jgi:hypothetical protein
MTIMVLAYQSMLDQAFFPNLKRFNTSHYNNMLIGR